MSRDPSGSSAFTIALAREPFIFISTAIWQHYYHLLPVYVEMMWPSELYQELHRILKNKVKDMYIDSIRGSFYEPSYPV